MVLGRNRWGGRFLMSEVPLPVRGADTVDVMVGTRVSAGMPR